MQPEQLFGMTVKQHNAVMEVMERDLREAGDREVLEKVREHAGGNWRRVW